MIMKLLKCCERKYLILGILAAITIMGEVVLEICIPTLMAKMVNEYIPLAKVAETADEGLKKRADYIAEYTNEEGAVGKIIEKFGFTE